MSPIKRGVRNGITMTVTMDIKLVSTSWSHLGERLLSRWNISTELLRQGGLGNRRLEERVELRPRKMMQEEKCQGL